MCPYCNERERNSDDHVFPEFLGGRTTIKICKQCNDKFGHSFEAAVSEDIAPVTVFLSACGHKAPRKAIWKGCFIDKETGIKYDLDTNLTAIPSSPRIERDQNGIFVRAIYRDVKEAQKAGQSLKNKKLAREVRVTSVKEEKPLRNLPDSRFLWPIGPEIRRLAVKMCVGLADYFHRDANILEPSVQAYLLGQQSQGTAVQLGYRDYQNLEAERSPLAHLVFVEADSLKKRCYGIFQLYGTIQLFATLNNDYSGPTFASLGILDIRSYEERFTVSKLLELPTPPRFNNQDEVRQGKALWTKKLNDQISAAFGEGMPKLNIGKTFYP